MKTDSALERANTTAGTTLSHGGRNAHGGGRSPEHVAESIAGVAPRGQAITCSYISVITINLTDVPAVPHNSRFQQMIPQRPGTPATLTRVALLGFGTVGQAVARILTEQPPPGVRLTHVFNRNVARKRAAWVPGDVTWTEHVDDILSADVDIVVELVGGLEPAGTWVRRALASGKSVVTANKQLIAHHGAELLALAGTGGVDLRFEGSVAGGIPILSALRDGLTGDSMSRVSGILNGTCNFILTSMESRGVTFQSALAEAQALGFAEADPTDDVEGYDARAKLAILCGSALRARVTPSSIATRPITIVDAVDFVHAQRLGCTIRQVSQAEWSPECPDCLEAVVRPALVPFESALARVSGSQNIVVLRGRYGGETVFSGSGAGGGPTSVAVVSDVAAIARNAAWRAATAGAAAELGDPGTAAVEAGDGLRTPASVTGEFVTPHYLRFIVRDKPAILSAIAGAMGRHAINIDAVLQLPADNKDALPFVVTIESCPPAALNGAMAEIAALDFHVQPPMDLPILGSGA
jgi:homoserine dehydrogenase